MNDLYSSNFNLLMVNVWIGLCKGVKGLPKDLANLGYRDFAVEYKFKNSVGRDVMPELIIGSEKENHAVLLEWKCGNNFEDDQLERYAKVTSDDLKTKAFLPAVVCRQNDICIVGKTENGERLKKGIEAKFEFPLVLASPSLLKLEINKFQSLPIDSLFKAGLIVDLSNAPISFVQFNEESANWEIAEVLLPSVIQRMINKQARVLLDDLCKEHVSNWEVMPSEKKNQYKAKVGEVISEASRREFKPFLRRNKSIERTTHTPTWEIWRNPLDFGASKRSSEFRKLARLFTEFVRALKSGRRPNLQEDLFESGTP